MKKSLVLIISILTMLIAVGCANQSYQGAKDLHPEISKAEHERRFPGGHIQVPGVEGDKCAYNEKNESYLCQFDWSE
jgi:hypothetical protein